MVTIPRTEWERESFRRESWWDTSSDPDEPTWDLWHDPLAWCDAQALPPEQARAVISRFRQHYHKGPPERRILSPEQRAYFMAQAQAVGRRDLLPDDVREFRLTHYGDPLEDLPMGAGGLVPTWMVLPNHALVVRLRPLSFVEHLPNSTVYLSYLSTGLHVFQTPPQQALAVIRSLMREWNGEFYIFPEDMRWCMAVSTFCTQVVGDFAVFKPSASPLSHLRTGAPKSTEGCQSSFPGQRLYPQDAVDVISQFRRRYHQGPPEEHLSQAYLKRMSRVLAQRQEQALLPLPQDISDFRMQQYGEVFPGVGVSLVISTFEVLPQKQIVLSYDIFSHPRFLAQGLLYFAWRSLGEYVSVVSPAEVGAYLRTDSFQSKYSEYFIFDQDMNWCLAVNRRDQVVLVGDKDIFA